MIREALFLPDCHKTAVFAKNWVCCQKMLNWQTATNAMIQRRCIHCGSKNVAKIIYGYVMITDCLEKKLDSGKVILGGCCVEPSISPRWSCNECHSMWEKIKESDLCNSSNMVSIGSVKSW